MSADGTSASGRWPRGAVAGLVVLGLVVAAVGVLVVGRGQWANDAPRASLAGTGAVETASPPVPLAADEAYVVTEVLPSGDLMVTQWVESSQPLSSVELVLPPVAVAEKVTAEETRVVADGRIVSLREQTISGNGWRYSFRGATSVQIRYRLTGAIELSSSAPGRALARLSALDVTYEPASRRVTRTVIAPEVLSLACSSPAGTTPPRPCGSRLSRGEWTVVLDQPRAADRVMAQLTLG